MIGLDKTKTNWFDWEKIGSILSLANFFLNGHVVMRRERQNRSDYKSLKDITDLTIAVLLHFRSNLRTLLALFVINSIRFRWDLSMVAQKYMTTQFDEHGELKNYFNLAVGWRQIHTREASLHQQMLPHQSLSQWRGMSGDLWHSQHQV